MKKLLMSILCLASIQMMALDCKVQLDNDQMTVAIVKIMPHEEIGLHRDEYPQIIIALKGGTITRLEADGSTTDVVFPTGEAVFRGIDPPDVLHKSVNRGEEEIELVIIQRKS